MKGLKMKKPTDFEIDGIVFDIVRDHSGGEGVVTIRGIREAIARVIETLEKKEQEDETVHR